MRCYAPLLCLVVPFLRLVVPSWSLLVRSYATTLPNSRPNSTLNSALNSTLNKTVPGTVLGSVLGTVSGSVRQTTANNDKTCQETQCVAASGQNTSARSSISNDISIRRINLFGSRQRRWRRRRRRPRVSSINSGLAISVQHLVLLSALLVMTLVVSLVVSAMMFEERTWT